MAGFWGKTLKKFNKCGKYVGHMVFIYYIDLLLVPVPNVDMVIMLKYAANKHPCKEILTFSIFYRRGVI